MATERFEYPTHADDGKTWQDTMQGAIDDPVATAEECVTDHPLAAVGLTMAAGFVGGLLVAGMLSDVRRSRRPRSYVQRAGDRVSTAADRTGNFLADIGQTVRDAVADAVPDPDDLLARFR